QHGQGGGIDLAQIHPGRCDQNVLTVSDREVASAPVGETATVDRTCDALDLLSGSFRSHLDSPFCATSTNRSASPKLPDVRMRCKSRRSSWIHGAPNAASSPTTAVAVPRALTTSPDVSPPAMSIRPTPRS